MKWIFDHSQVIFLIGFALFSAIKVFLEAKAKQAEKRNEEWNPTEIPPIENDESYRKPLKKAIPPPLRKMAEYETALETAAELKHQQKLADRLRQIRETKATTTGGAAATRIRIAPKGESKKITLSPASIKSRLKDPSEVRNLFVMREILDPPVGLR